MKCQHCDKDEPLPFKCPYCNGYFCAEHRLPESHNCSGQWTARTPTPSDYSVTYAPPSPTVAVKPFSFSMTEVRDLTISAALVAGVGLSMVGFRLDRPEIVSLAAIFISVFLLHEIAHKLVAQRYGLWAEFRLTLFGALLTLLSAVPYTPIKIISPGAVLIAGPMTKSTMGKTAVAGPSTNLCLSVISFVFSLFTSDVLSDVAMLSAAFNAWIALFNLVPIAMLDGLKVYYWNKIIWGAAFILSLALTVLTFTQIYF